MNESFDEVFIHGYSNSEYAFFCDQKPKNFRSSNRASNISGAP